MFRLIIVQTRIYTCAHSGRSPGVVCGKTIRAVCIVRILQTMATLKDVSKRKLLMERTEPMPLPSRTKLIQVGANFDIRRESRRGSIDPATSIQDCLAWFLRPVLLRLTLLET